MQQSRIRRACRNPSPRMTKVTVHEKRRVNEEQPTPASSPSRNHDSTAPRQHPLICTSAEPIHQVHGPSKPRATFVCTLQLGREDMHKAHQDVNACICTSRQCMIRPHKVSMHEARGSMPMHEVHGIKTNTQCRKSIGIAKSEVSARYP